MRITTLLLGTFTFVAIPSIAHATSISYKCGSNAVVVVNDGGSADTAPALNVIRTKFTCDDVVDPGGNVWSGSGTILAQYGSIAPKRANFEVFDALWISEGDNFVSDHFDVTHNFPLIGGAQTRFSVGGQMVHPGAGVVDFVSLVLNVDIIKFVGGLHDIGTLGAFVGAAADPIAFGDSWPFTGHPDAVGQTARFDFYLGIPNDAFQFNLPQRMLIVTSQ